MMQSNPAPMRRVAVVGCGGSGKSTFARALGQATGLTVIHLDALYWHNGWVQSDTQQWDERHRQLISAPQWILDGNYSRTMAPRFEACDTAIFLDYPRWLCLLRAFWRRWMYRGRTRPDMAQGCPEKLDWEFVRWIWRFRRKSRPMILALAAQHSHRENFRFIRLKNPGQAKSFLQDAAKPREGEMARIIVLTGGIASGKSTVAAYLRDEKGAVVISADEVARELQQPGQPGYQAIRQAFGAQFFLPDGQLDRPKLGELIFADAKARAALDQMMHPLVYQWMHERAQALAQAGQPLIVLEIPLLFETNMQHRYNEIWLVAASEPVQLARLMRRDGIGEAKARARIAAQMPLGQKSALAHAVIITDEGEAALRAQVDALLSQSE